MRNNKVDKLLAFNFEIFPFLVTLTYFFLFLESYMYIGFLRNFFLFDSKFFLVLTIFSSTARLFFYTSDKKDSTNIALNNLISYTNKLLFPLVLIFYIILQISEASNHVNYVFSVFHLQPNNFFSVVTLSAVLLISDYVLKNEKIRAYVTQNFTFFLKSFKTNKVESVLIISIFSLLMYVFIINVSETFNKIFNSIFYISTHTHSTYDEKMATKWRFFYSYMNFVKANTPPTSKIVIPPQEAPWLETGNAGLVKSFLYPRTIISGFYTSLPDENFDYILLAKGRWLVNENERYGWPKLRVSAKKILYFDYENRNFKEVYEDYDPQATSNLGAWGLIQVKKD